ncbi:armadillo-type protein [Tribonema minus]|uniref:Armadillo-type protein n=1 Tax=Tribonema minus TaxID=303371 RepID=A0A835YXG5_9STRA|nr:armadillo-type protein [Tribonema minus]
MAAVAMLRPVEAGNAAGGASSAGGLLALLEEQDDALRTHALTRLAGVVDQYWAEVASAVPLIEEMSEDPGFPARELAASVASKVFFHLEEYNDALRLALGAGPHFDVTAKTEYVSTLVSRCIDEYVALRCADAPATIDARMEAIVERMFERCFTDGAWTQAMGIALEARRLDMVEQTVRRCDDKAVLLSYSFDLPLLQRRTQLQLLVCILFFGCFWQDVDHTAVVRCLQVLGEAALAAEVLKQLLRSTQDNALLAYQIAFDLVESENQHFIVEVTKHLPKRAVKAEGGAAPAATGAEEGKDADAMDTEPLLQQAAAEGGDEEFWGRVDKLWLVLAGNFNSDLSLNFMFKQTHTDVLILNNIKTAVETRNSVLHNATVAAHAFMNAGTTVDAFLREHLEWMGRATNWGKFSATASIGVVHKGHMGESMALLQPYLPQGGVSASPYSEGGALYALGLIHANHGAAVADGADVVAYLAKAVRAQGSNEAVLHGACLGLGLAAMATGSAELYEDLKNTLFTDSAVAGEGAALGIGLLMLGCGNSTEASSTAVKDMVAYAHETQHEKIIRGLAMGVALTMYGQEEGAEGLYEQLSRDRDPLLRYGAMYTLGLAYCGTSSNAAVRRLLHVAVSDVSDDVRLAAVTCLGFVMFRAPTQVPQLVTLLAESFNAHVRYGACMAIAVACAGTGAREAMDVLEPMMDDMVDFVRQGATIAMAMVLMQQSEAAVPKVKAFRARLSGVIGDKHQTTMTKMGAVLASGVLDAGGRNVTIALQSRAGFTKMASVVGLAMWCQHWYWYPLMHFLSLAFSPTLLIGLNKDFKMPRQWSVTCHARPSLFAYPKKTEEKKEDKRERVTTVTLSTTAKAKAREHRKELEKKKEEGGGSGGKMEVDKEEPAKAPMDVDKEPAKAASVTFADGGAEETKGGEEESKGESTAGDAKPEGEGKTEEETAAVTSETATKKKKEPEPTSFTCGNPSRITPPQVAVVAFDLNQRYVPVRASGKPVGIVMLVDTTPDADEDVAAVEAPTRDGGAEEDAPPPEPFEWSPKSK